MKFTVEIEYDLVRGKIADVVVPSGVLTSAEVYFMFIGKTYEVWITDAGTTKIALIKRIREIYSMGLKEMKDCIDGVRAVRSDLSLSEAEVLKRDLESYGATVEIR